MNRLLLVSLVACACSSSPKPAPAAPATAPAPAAPAAPSAIDAAIAATDRTDADRALDGGRKPGEVLAFFHIAPGEKVGELFAGGGYTTELLARVTGPTGKVYAQNDPVVLEKFLQKPWSERMTHAAMKDVVPVARATDDPFPPEAHDLDAVIMILNYHDTIALGTDRAKMNAAVFAALRPGGIYGIVDSSAADGSGTRDSSTLHRIDEAVVKQEILAAGFKLDAESDSLRNPADTRDWSSSPKAAGARRGTSDRFVLRFVKP
jgi:predicted methyltransferase